MIQWAYISFLQQIVDFLQKFVLSRSPPVVAFGEKLHEMAWEQRRQPRFGLNKSYQLSAHKAQDLIWRIRPAIWIGWNG
jgi:hypothetical protein